MTESEVRETGIRGGGKGKFDRAMFAKRPMTGEDPGWIVVISRSNLDDYLMRGFEALWQYGFIKEGEGLWERILKHPDGPAEFPVEQILQLRWWLPEDCPVKGIKFPQLEGHRAKGLKCPECKRSFYTYDGLGGIEDLGRHLRITHSWPWPSLVKYGEKAGIDFEAIYSNIEKTYEFDGGAIGEAPEEAPPDESGLVKVGEFDCDECDWKPKLQAKQPGVALFQHKRHAHPQPVSA